MGIIASDGRVVHDNSLANLKMIKPGEVRNPRGRSSGSLYISEAMRMLSNATESELKVVAKDKSARAALRIAAKQYLTALRTDGAHLRDAGDSADRIADRLEGKPTQVQRITSDVEPPKQVIVFAPQPPTITQQREGGGVLGTEKESSIEPTKD